MSMYNAPGAGINAPQVSITLTFTSALADLASEVSSFRKLIENFSGINQRAFHANNPFHVPEKLNTSSDLSERSLPEQLQYLTLELQDLRNKLDTNCKNLRDNLGFSE